MVIVAVVEAASTVASPEEAIMTVDIIIMAGIIITMVGITEGTMTEVVTATGVATVGMVEDAMVEVMAVVIEDTAKIDDSRE